MNKTIFVSLLLLLILTPLPYGTVEVWSVTAWELWIFVTLLLWGSLVVTEGKIAISRNPLSLPLLGLLLLAVIQILPLLPEQTRNSLSHDAKATAFVAIKLLAFLFFLLLFATFINTTARRLTVSNAIIALAFMIALIGIGQSYIGKALWQRGTFGPFVNRNHFAGFLEMGLGLTGGLLVGRAVKRERIAIYGCIIVVLLIGLIVSASRGGMIAFAGGAIFLGILGTTAPGTDQTGRKPALLRALAVIILFVAMVAGIMTLAGPDELLTNFSRLSLSTGTEVVSAENVDINDQYPRRDLWAATGQMIKDHPLFGVGLGAYPMAYPRYDPSSGIMRVEQAHNDYLQVMADGGIIGGLLACAFLYLLFRYGLKAMNTRDQQHRAVVIGALTGCFALLVHSFVDFNLQVTANAQLFLALAILATTPRPHQPVT